MQPKPLFPSLPRNVSTVELRQEIRRRMEIADRIAQLESFACYDVTHLKPCGQALFSLHKRKVNWR